MHWFLEIVNMKKVEDTRAINPKKNVKKKINGFRKGDKQISPTWFQVFNF